MEIDEILIPESREQHLWQAHQVTPDEVYEAFEDEDIRIERARDELPGRSGLLYLAFGRAENGRLLLIVFRYFADNRTAYVITARDMTTKEKRKYMR
ncbi:MAG: BrnT family toxin [Alicyclobacillus sp.]|nr:BrnT family toxin [Alicyclobacillus sp.]